MRRTLATAHGELVLPAFLPDATRGVVRTLDSNDLVAAGIPALVVNTLHLSNQPGITVVERLGGIHGFMGWHRPVMSDSGGFQVLSLARESADLVSVTNRGLYFRRTKKGDKQLLSPEKCVQQQFALGADVMFCLDHCTHPSEPEEHQRASVEHTVLWSRRCKEEFERRVERFPDDRARPLLFAVVQGGPSIDLRRECAQRLVEIGFDGFGYGGWPIDDAGELVPMVHEVARLLPADAPKHALGIGKPEHVVAAFQAGYHTFDCVLPTRDARQGRVTVLDEDWQAACTRSRAFYKYLYIKDDKHCVDSTPIDASCDCPTCTRYSRAYVHHLFRVDESAGQRLATIHNLRFYARLVERLGEVPA